MDPINCLEKLLGAIKRVVDEIKEQSQNVDYLIRLQKRLEATEQVLSKVKQ